MRIRPRKFDVGEVLTNERVAITEDMKMPELHERLSSVGAALLVECIKDLNRYRPIEQNHSQASYGELLQWRLCNDSGKVIF